jgi:hypothetical protein
MADVPLFHIEHLANQKQQYLTRNQTQMLDQKVMLADRKIIAVTTSVTPY